MRTLLLCLLMGGWASSHAYGGQVGALPDAPPRDARITPKVGTGSIAGRVTAADTKAPLRRALVNLGGPFARATYTDDEGRYTFTRLPAGTYWISATAGSYRAGYQPGAYGGSLAAPMVMRGKPVDLTDGQKQENIDVALPRAAVIAGRVTDMAGQPASRVQVHALLLRAGSEPSMTSSTATNDLGEFRLFGLMPGDYVVRASITNNPGGPEMEGEALGVAPSYAPGVAPIAEAMRIRLGHGTEATADIRLIETRVFTVTGAVLTSSGEPARGGSITVVDRDSRHGLTFGTGVGADGTFAFRNIPPGSYELISRYQPQRPAGSPPTPVPVGQEVGTVRVDVSGDIENVLIATTPGAVVSGEALFEEPLPAGGRVNISVAPAETRNFIGVPSVEMAGTQFTVRGVFGPVLLRGNASGGSNTWTLKAVRLRGKDITDEPVTFTAADSGHLQVLFTSKATVLEGVVTGDDGQPAPDSVIILFGQDEKTWRPRSSLQRTAPVAKDGRFTMRSLREGRYYAAAVSQEVMANVGQPTPEFLETLRGLATAFTLNEGETRTLDLRLLKFERP